MDLGEKVLMHIPNPLIEANERIGDRRSARRPARGERMVVKVQITLVFEPDGSRFRKEPEDEDTITIYDATHTVHCLVQRRGQVVPWQKLWDAVVTQGFEGSKAYVDAKMSDDGKKMTLRVGKVLKPQRW